MAPAIAPAFVTGLALALETATAMARVMAPVIAPAFVMGLASALETVTVMAHVTAPVMAPAFVTELAPALGTAMAMACAIVPALDTGTACAMAPVVSTTHVTVQAVGMQRAVPAITAEPATVKTGKGKTNTKMVPHHKEALPVLTGIPC